MRLMPFNQTLDILDQKPCARHKTHSLQHPEHAWDQAPEGISVWGAKLPYQTLLVNRYQRCLYSRLPFARIHCLWSRNGFDGIESLCPQTQQQVDPFRNIFFVTFWHETLHEINNSNIFWHILKHIDTFWHVFDTFGTLCWHFFDTSYWHILTLLKNSVFSYIFNYFWHALILFDLVG